MAKYIDADAMIEDIKSERNNWDLGGDYTAFHFLNALEKAPAADVEPVRKWIPCSERLPVFEGRYLVAMKDGDKYHISIRKWKASAGWHRGGAWERNTGGVRFWKFLPESPKKDGGSE